MQQQQEIKHTQQLSIAIWQSYLSLDRLQNVGNIVMRILVIIYKKQLLGSNQEFNKFCDYVAQIFNTYSMENEVIDPVNSEQDLYSNEHLQLEGNPLRENIEFYLPRSKIEEVLTYTQSYASDAQQKYKPINQAVNEVLQSSKLIIIGIDSQFHALFQNCLNYLNEIHADIVENFMKALLQQALTAQLVEQLIISILQQSSNSQICKTATQAVLFKEPCFTLLHKLMEMICVVNINLCDIAVFQALCQVIIDAKNQEQLKLIQIQLLESKNYYIKYIQLKNAFVRQENDNLNTRQLASNSQQYTQCQQTFLHINKRLSDSIELESQEQYNPAKVFQIQKQKPEQSSQQLFQTFKITAKQALKQQTEVKTFNQSNSHIFARKRQVFESGLCNQEPIFKKQLYTEDDESNMLDDNTPDESQ